MVRTRACRVPPINYGAAKANSGRGAASGAAAQHPGDRQLRLLGGEDDYAHGGKQYVIPRRVVHALQSRSVRASRSAVGRVELRHCQGAIQSAETDSVRGETGILIETAK